MRVSPSSALAGGLKLFVHLINCLAGIFLDFMCKLIMGMEFALLDDVFEVQHPVRGKGQGG
jgi:hypothetical protein